ncbi:MAG: 23S rRNA (uracil(1939)-C(5))-methyltransferase RlmD [Collinsella sp.]|nr:23S rRNA (uracil(1939)-C(5))-methyltransferase RlmD [Collinsella sp.]
MRRNAHPKRKRPDDLDRRHAGHGPARDRDPRPTTTSDGPCPIMRLCGGCAWLGLPYHKQLARKQQAMEELFSPVALESGIEIDPIWGMGGRAGDGKLPAPRGFRHKAATPFAPGPRGEVRCGFFARGTHDIVFASSCIVEARGARGILASLAKEAEGLGIPAYDEDARRGDLRHAIVRLGWRTSEGMLVIVTSHRKVAGLDRLAEAALELDPRITCVAQNINPRVTNAILGGETRVIAGATTMHDKLLGCTFEISPTAFYQTNPQQTEALYRIAIEGMDLQDGDTLLDAYCGSGTIGLCAVDDARSRGISVRLLGIERNKAGIADARRNAVINDLEGSCEFIARDATDHILDAARQGLHVDVLSIDPPRAGSTPEFLDAAASLAPRRIVYVSCNPQTQVRDIRHLSQRGYRLTQVTPVDMFPHTEHVETVAVLEREMRG